MKETLVSIPRIQTSPLLWLTLACHFAMAAPEVPPDFARDVHPILVAKCTGCHATGKAAGGLALNTRAELMAGGASGPSISPGDAAGSLLLKRVTGAKMPVMPLGAPPLSAGEIAVLREWIQDGAKAPEKQSFSAWKPQLSPRNPAVPPGWGNPVDYFIDRYLQARKISMPAPVSDEVFARRAYLDLWGLLPTPEQLAQFRGEPGRPALVAQLLNHRENYSEHWVSFWNDLLHNDEGVTYIGDRRSISKWLLGSLNSNLPYDKMVATLMNPPDDESAGFIMGVNWRGDINASQTPVMQAAQNSAQVFMGVNLKCNSCHDSFISSWKLKDAYGLASFFSQEPLEIARCDVKTGKIAEPSFLYPQLGGISAKATLSERRRAAAELFTHPENGRLARTLVNRIWQRLMGRGLVEPADDMDAEPWDPDLLDWLASDFANHGYDINHLLTRILTSKAYAMPPVPGKAEKEPRFTFRGPLYRRMTAEQFADAVSSVSTEWRVLGSAKPQPGTYAREWRFKSDALARALGRPSRDLAVTERFNDPTMLQMLELVNGPTLANVVRRGARRLLDDLPPAPAPLFDSGAIRDGKVLVDCDIRSAQELRLLIADSDSYDPGRVTAGWADARLIRDDGTAVALAELKSRQAYRQGQLKIKGDVDRPALLNKVPSEIVFNVAGKKFSRLQAVAGVDEGSLASEISPKVRFYVFASEPDPKQLGPVTGEPPVKVAGSKHPSNEALIQRIFEHALGRKPEPAEKKIAGEFLAAGNRVDGLEDLLWSVFMMPEFQYIR